MELVLGGVFVCVFIIHVSSVLRDWLLRADRSEVSHLQWAEELWADR